MQLTLLATMSRKSCSKTLKSNTITANRLAFGGLHQTKRTFIQLQQFWLHSMTRADKPRMQESISRFWNHNEERQICCRLSAFFSHRRRCFIFLEFAKNRARIGQLQR